MVHTSNSSTLLFNTVWHATYVYMSHMYADEQDLPRNPKRKKGKEEEKCLHGMVSIFKRRRCCCAAARAGTRKTATAVAADGERVHSTSGSSRIKAGNVW